jgi:putative PEP-CTERM system TPR-repeat lipoprotein
MARSSGILRSIVIAWLAMLVVACGDRADPEKLLPKIDASMAAGQWRAAFIDLRNLLQRHPDNQAARLRLGLVALELGDVETAEQELANARKRGANADQTTVPYARALWYQRKYDEVLSAGDPATLTDKSQQAQLHRLRGHALLALRRPKEARESFDAAIALDPNDVESAIGRVFSTMDVDGMQEARTRLALLTREHPNDPRVANATGAVLMQAGDYTGANAAYLRALKMMPAEERSIARATALSGLAETQFAVRDLPAVNVTTRALLALTPGSSDAVLLRVRYLFLNREYDEARTRLEQILARDGRNAKARTLLGAVNLAAGAYGQAEMHLSNVLVSDPTNDLVRLLLATTRLHQRKPEGALDAIAENTKASEAETILMEGQASLQSGDRTKGLALLEQSAQAPSSGAEFKLQLAAAFLEAGQYDRSRKVLEEIPNDPRLDYRRGLLLISAHLRSKDRDGALKQSRALIARYPNDAVALFAYGRLLAMGGSLAEAQAQFEKVLKLQPGNETAMVNLANLLRAQKRSVQAQRLLNEGVATNPKSAVLRVALAQIALAEGRLDETARQLEAACAADPRAAEPRVLLAQLRLNAKDFVSAATLAGEALQISPDDPAALNILSVSLTANGRASDAVKRLKDAVTRDPAFAAAHIGLARAYAADGRSDEALAEAEAAVKAEPNYVPGLALAAALTAARGDSTGARGYLERLRGVAPTHTALFAIGGELALKSGDYTGAAKLFAEGRKHEDSAGLALREFAARRAGKLPDATRPLQEWLTRSPNDTRVKLALAQSQSESGNGAAARAAYEGIVAKDPGNAVALNNLALLYLDAKDPRALPTARRAQELMPDRADVLDTYGWIALQTGDLKLALEQLARAAERAPDAPDIQYHRAVALARDGKADTARQILRQALGTTRPFAERESARQLLASLESSRPTNEGG